ncbi:hypothetical protein AC481_06605 [miscellaneous Crenarchaeota group archaeon SMTZ-80]|nr:MAG: hypothetical protein AC481_06605 [miscellaneous Crenarchaeota group archaeon SMTZ-80]
MELEDYFRCKKINIWEEKFVIAKSKKPLPKSFAIIQDKTEITVVIDQSKLKEEDVIEMEKDWKLLTIYLTIPFESTGFLSKITKVLANKKISIFVISGYSTDHILFKKKNLTKTKKKLEILGFDIQA